MGHETAVSQRERKKNICQCVMWSSMVETLWKCSSCGEGEKKWIILIQVGVFGWRGGEISPSEDLKINTPPSTLHPTSPFYLVRPHASLQFFPLLNNSCRQGQFYTGTYEGAERNVKGALCVHIMLIVTVFSSLNWVVSYVSNPSLEVDCTLSALKVTEACKPPEGAILQ